MAGVDVLSLGMFCRCIRTNYSTVPIYVVSIIIILVYINIRQSNYQMPVITGIFVKEHGNFIHFKYWNFGI